MARVESCALLTWVVLVVLVVTVFSGCTAVRNAGAVLTTKTKCLLNPLKECDKCECCTATNDLCCCRHADKCRCDPTVMDGKCCVAKLILK